VTDKVLEVKKLTKQYGAYRAVDNVTFAIRRGQVLGLLGPNGAGKSTTIQMLCGLTLPSSGSVKYFGQDFARVPQACLQRINFASAYNALQGRITVRENLIIFAGLYGVRKPRAKIDELLEYFEIARLAKSKYWDLSAGERTRVNLAKALINDPELILMDEPTASLDPDIADKVLALVEELRVSRQLSILFTSHNMVEVERICDEVVFLDHGRIVSQDTPANHTKRLGDATLILHFRGERALVERVLVSMGAQFVLPAVGVATIKAKSEAVAGMVAAVADAGVNIREVEVNKPTLEDVFLDIARGQR